MSFIAKFKQILDDLSAERKRDIPLPIYTFWWVIRLLLVYAAIKSSVVHGPDTLQLWVNVLLSYIFTFFKFFPKDKFIFSRFPFRLETIALILNLVTTYFGNYLNLYYTFPAWDTIIHFFGAVVGVYFGYEFTVAAAKRQKEFTPIVGAICGVGFCSWGAIFWEIFEFTYDQLTGGNIQHWRLDLTLGGNGAEIFHYTNPMRYALFDTMSDLIFGFAGSMIGGVIVFIWLARRARKAAALTEQKEKVQVLNSREK